MNRTARILLVLTLAAALLMIPLMVRTVLSADPTPTPGPEDDNPLEPTPAAPQRELSTLSEIPGENDGGAIPESLHENKLNQSQLGVYAPRIAYNGDDDQFLVIWQNYDGTGPTDLAGRYLNAEGEPLTEVFTIAENLAGPVDTGLYYGGGTYLLLWREGEDPFQGELHSLVISGAADQTPSMGEDVVIMDPILDDFDAVYDLNRDAFQIIWLDARSPELSDFTRGEIYGRRISTAGELLGEEQVFLSFDQVPGWNTTEKILKSPSRSGKLSITHSSSSDQYLAVYNNYYCYQYSCDFREDVYGIRVAGGSLALLNSPFGIAENLSGIQWNARVVYQPRMDEFLVVWSDNRRGEDNFDLYGRRLSGDGSTGGLDENQLLVEGYGNQKNPWIRVIPGEGDQPAYVLAWQEEPASGPHQVSVQYLDESGIPRGTPQVPSNLPGRTREDPSVAVGSTELSRVIMVWKDISSSGNPNIHSRRLQAEHYLAGGLHSPVNFTMVFSVRPTLTWKSIPDAVSYQLEIYPYRSTGFWKEEFGAYQVDAEASRLVDDPDLHAFKPPRPLTIGPTLEEAASYWRVTAKDEAGETLAVTQFGVFQIPPLGLEPDRPYWSAYDRTIYHWSEVYDLPPNLYKAVLASESGDMHVWFELDPTRGYLYEAKHDETTCHPNGSEGVNYCVGEHFEPFLIGLDPGNRQYEYQPPEVWPGNTPSLRDNPSLKVMVGTMPYASMSNWLAMARYTGCTGYPHPADSTQFYDCISDWYDGRYKKAEYRVMVGYGLSGINYWTNLNILYRADTEKPLPYQPPPDASFTPEDLYSYDLNIRMGTRVLSDKRCWWHNASGSRKPFLDPESPDHVYLSAQDYREEDFNKWRQVLASYAGFNFHYPMWYGGQLQVGRVEWRFFGQKGNGDPYYSTQPVDLSGFAELGTAVDVQIEDSPQQYSQDKIYGEFKEEDVWDTDYKLCPYPGYDQVSGDAPENLARAETGGAFVLQAQTNQGVTLHESEIQFSPYRDPVWITLTWLGDPEVHALHQAVIRIYEDSTKSILLWESPPLEDVTSKGFGMVKEVERWGVTYFMAEFAVSMHSSQTFIVEGIDQEYKLLQFNDPNNVSTNRLVSTGGGAFFQPDGSIAVLHRGVNPAEQIDVDVFAQTWDGYEYQRSYTRDETVEDTTLPTTTAAVSQPPNPEGWNTFTAVTFTSTDNYGVEYVDCQEFGVQEERSRRSYLSVVEIYPDEGLWEIQCQATDIYGNTGHGDQVNLMIDGTPPRTEVTFDGAWDPAAGGYRSPVEFTAVSHDPLLADGTEGSGVVVVEYSLDFGQTWHTYQDPVEIEGVGEHDLWVRAVDAAGNHEAPLRLSFQILSYGVEIQPVPDRSRNEGEEVTVSTSFQDHDPDASHEAVFGWGDGSPETAGLIVPLAEGQWGVTGGHVYQDDGVYAAYLEVTSGSGLSDRVEFTVTVENLPPVVEAGPDQTALPGETVQFAGSVTDPGTLDTHTYTWDFGDGATAEGTLTPSHAYAALGEYTVTLTAVDDDGGEGSDTLLVSVVNRPPDVELGEPVSLVEGEALSRKGSFTDPGSDSWTGEVDYGLGDGFQPLSLDPDGTFLLEQVYHDDGAYTVTVKITDEYDAVGEATLAVEAANAPPAVSLDGPAALEEGDTFTGSGSFTDPGADTWSATVDYGDGAGPGPLALDGTTFQLENLYPEDGEYRIAVCVADDDGGEGCAELTLAVSNLPPIVEAGPDQTVELGSPVTLSGSFTDSGLEDTHTVRWDFGDGTGADGQLTVEHTYQAVGEYTAVLTVTDDEGAEGSDSLVVTVEPPAGDWIALDDRRSDHCLALDRETGAFRWYAENGEVYTGTVELQARGRVVLFGTSFRENPYLRGLLVLEPELGMARLRTGWGWRAPWYTIFDRDFKDPAACP
jgi:PKD repeat protein